MSEEIFSEDIENAFLSSMMLNSEALAKNQDMPLAAFFMPANKILYQALKEFYSKGRPVDHFLLADYLQHRQFGKKSNGLEEIGGKERLADLFAFVGSSNWQWYRRLVLQYHRRRLIPERERNVLLREITQLKKHISWLEAKLPMEQRIESWTKLGQDRGTNRIKL